MSFLVLHIRTGQTSLPGHTECWKPAGFPMEPAPEKKIENMKTTLLLQHWVVELCFLQAGRKKEKNRKRPCQGCLVPSPKLTNQVSLCSPREEVIGVRERRPFITRMHALLHAVGDKSPPNNQPGFGLFVHHWCCNPDKESTSFPIMFSLQAVGSNR